MAPDAAREGTRRRRPPPARRGARARGRDLAYGGRGLARRDGYVVFVSGGLPGDRVRAEVTQGEEAASPRRARSSCSRPSADRVADVCVHGGEPCPGAPWQGLPYERQLAAQAAAGRRGAAPDRRPRGVRARADRARRRAVALPQQARVLVRRRATASSSSASTPAAAGTVIVDVDDCLLASERGNAARNEVRDWAAPRGHRRPTTAAPATGVLRNLVVREGRRTGELQTRLVTSPAAIPEARRSTCTR